MIDGVNFRETEFSNELVEMDSLFFPNPWTLGEWKTFLRTHKTKIYILEKGREIIGFSLFSIDAFSKQVHLLKLVVSTKERNSGLGRTLLADSLKILAQSSIRDCYLEVSVDNLAAVSLYKRLGFQTLVLKKKFYSDGQDAYAMQLFFE